MPMDWNGATSRLAGRAGALGDQCSDVVGRSDVLTEMSGRLTVHPDRLSVRYGRVADIPRLRATCLVARDHCPTNAVRVPLWDTHAVLIQAAINALLNVPTLRQMREDLSAEPMAQATLEMHQRALQRLICCPPAQVQVSQLFAAFMGARSALSVLTLFVPRYFCRRHRSHAPS